jgi:hypothetical protein
VAQTGEKFAGWKKIRAKRPRNPESLMGPRVERASKSAATSPIRSVRRRSIVSVVFACSFQCCEGGCNRQKQPLGFPSQEDKFVSLIKSARVAVFRIDDERECPDAESIRTHGCVHNERPAKAAAAIVQMNREPAHEHCQHRWIAGQTLGYLCGNAVEGNACCRQRVVTREDACLGERDKTSGNAPVNVLERKLFQVAVKRVDATGELATVVVAAERFGD